MKPVRINCLKSALIEKGAVRSTKDLQDAFAKAEHAVAKHHYLRAAEAWAKKLA